jgi:tetratricopeptide (TPR) repeat protein
MAPRRPDLWSRSALPVLALLAIAGLTAFPAVSRAAETPARNAVRQGAAAYWASTRSRLLEYVQLLKQYREGDRAAAVERLAAWDDGRTILELISFPATLKKLERQVTGALRETRDGVTTTHDITAFIADPEAAARAGWGEYRTLSGDWAVYTVPELARIASAIGYTALHPTVNPYLRLAAFVHEDVARHCWETIDNRNRAEWHWQLATRALQPLEEIESERPFVRTWYLLTIIETFRLAAFAETGFFVERAAWLFPEDADIALAHGCLYETLAMVVTRKMTIPGIRELHVNEPTENLQQAERDFRRAVDLGAGPAARIRLGNVLVLQGRGAEAVKELDLARAEVIERARRRTIPDRPLKESGTARAAEHDRALLYQALLIRGMALEASGDVEGARQAYAAAAETCPAAQSPLVALSHLAFMGADRQRPLAALAPALHVESEDLARDPWWRYRYGNAWDDQELLAQLWEMISQ